MNADIDRPWPSIIFILPLLLCCSCIHKPTQLTPIVLDGTFKDWENIPTQLDERSEPTISEFDILSVRTHHSDDQVHVMLTLDRSVNLQGLDSPLNLLLDLDNLSTTGSTLHEMKGVDLVVQFSPPNQESPSSRGMGVGVRRITESTRQIGKAPTVPHAAIGLLMAPTYASENVELALSRSTSIPAMETLFPNNSFRMKWVHTSNAGILTEETAIQSHSLKPSIIARVKDNSSRHRLAKNPSDLRVMTWNVEYGTILKKPTLYARILRAINPDVILLQELTQTEEPDRLKAFFNEQIPREGLEWQVLLSSDTGSIGNGIATPLPIEAVPALSRIPYPNRPEWAVRAIGGKVTLRDGKKLLLSSVHLKCCGRIGSREDETRLLETAAINKSIKQATDSDQFDGIITGGDLNLVGAYTPIERLAVGLDFDQTNLSILSADRLDSRSNATWANPDERFVPGRLDYLLLSRSSLSERKAFVLNTAELSTDERTRYGLQPNDSSEASDHFPIIADLYFTNAQE
ncbi:endonuclease/exonuclease/phosphatase family protein [Verrucomicrobia bacterium]|jgi:endonuclease/exonuclease/phosphatase family metal-dependent hydrolase|nr:endonuclease/exonuclease/phosphatase family protein [Verrucomicrobiota bacterium]